MSESSEVQELQEKDVVIDRITKLFGDVAQKFQGKLIKILPESLSDLGSPVRKKLKDLTQFWIPTYF